MLWLSILTLLLFPSLTFADQLVYLSDSCIVNVCKITYIEELEFMPDNYVVRFENGENCPTGIITPEIMNKLNEAMKSCP